MMTRMDPVRNVVCQTTSNGKIKIKVVKEHYERDGYCFDSVFSCGAFAFDYFARSCSWVYCLGTGGPNGKKRWQAYLKPYPSY